MSFKEIFMRRKCLLVAMMVLFLCLGLMSAQQIGSNQVQPVNALVSRENYVAITFDDGPQYKTTLQLLDGLKERGVVATFFLVGEKIEERKEVVSRMQEDGHLIGNHTYSHINLNSVSIDKAMEEVNQTNQLIYDITGVMPTYIRPPFGNWSRQMEEKISMTPVLWTVDPCDWNTKDINKVVDCVLKNTENGDIILMHDIYDTSVTAALEIIDRLKAQGYVFVTVDQLMLD